MSPYLSFIIFVFALVGIIIGLINALRKYKNQFIKLRWILIPLVFSIAVLIIDIHFGNLDWLANELSTQDQNSLKIENKKLNNNAKEGDINRKIISKKEKKESQTLKDSFNTDKLKSKQFEQKLSSRILTREQRNKFVSLLKDKPKGNFIIKYVAGDAEAFEYSKNISDMLIGAGYNRSGKINHFVGNDAIDGISIVINSDETQPIYAKSIFAAFRSIGINIQAERNKKLVKPLEVLISVGHKN